MKNTLIFLIFFLFLIFSAQPVMSESVSFKLSVTIPPLVQMNLPVSPTISSTTSAPAADIKITAYGNQMVQEQTMVRNQETVLVRSIVVL